MVGIFMAEINNVLVVDDDPAMLQLAEMSLSQLGGFNVKACESGKTAVDALNSFNPDIILLDSNMPEMDGPETLKAIRSNDKFSTVPVVFVTGDARVDEVENLKAHGAIDVIVKPFDPMQFPEQIRAIGQRL